MKLFNSLSLTKIPGRSSTTNEDTKKSKLKISVSIKSEISDQVNNKKTMIKTDHSLLKDPANKSYLTKQINIKELIEKTKHDLNKIQNNLLKLKGDLVC